MEILRDFNITSIIFRIALAMFVSGLLGFERGIKNRPAGLRTYMLVSVGACIVMLTGEYVYEIYGDAGDPTRLAAQVVSGIGFLGAGAIITTGDQKVKGITTAASIWTAACMGIACGVGFYEVVLIGSVSIFMIMVIFTYLDTMIKKSAQKLEIRIEYDDYEKRKKVYEYLNENVVNIEKIEKVSIEKNGIAKVDYELDLNGKFEEDIIAKLEILDGVIKIKKK